MTLGMHTVAQTIVVKQNSFAAKIHISSPFARAFARTPSGSRGRRPRVEASRSNFRSQHLAGAQGSGGHDVEVACIFRQVVSETATSR